MTPSPTEKQEAARRIAEAEKGEPAKIASEAQNQPATGTAVVEATSTPPGPVQPVQGGFRRYVVKKPKRIPMTIRVPEELYDNLQLIEKFGGRTMTDVIVESTAPAAAALAAAIERGEHLG
jgi:hypothetical protein